MLASSRLLHIILIVDNVLKTERRLLVVTLYFPPEATKQSSHL